MITEKYYILNLSHRTDRKEICEDQLKKANINNYEFIESIPWDTLSQEYLDKVINLKYKHRTPDLYARYGLVACGLSHIKAYDAILNSYGNSGDKAFVIFEDDFFIENTNTFKETLDKIINMTDDWQFIQLGGLRNHKEDKREDYLPGLQKIISVWNAHAYVIKNDLEFINKMKTLVDDGYFADRATRKVIRDDKRNAHKYLITWPYEVNQLKNYSDINRRVR